MINTVGTGTEVGNGALVGGGGIRVGMMVGGRCVGYGVMVGFIVGIGVGSHRGCMVASVSPIMHP